MFTEAFVVYVTGDGEHMVAENWSERQGALDVLELHNHLSEGGMMLLEDEELDKILAVLGDRLHLPMR